jgi:hypothetical protein
MTDIRPYFHLINNRAPRAIVLIIVSLAFFILPSLLNLDYLIPFMFALVSFILGVGSFYKGYSEK